MTEVAEAERSIFAAMPQAAAERVPLEHCTARVLAEDVHAERDQPPFDRVMMDGIALAHRDFAGGRRRFTVVGTQGAGAEALAIDEPGQCVEVMTGAKLPSGCDTVIPVERLWRRGDEIEVQADLDVAAGQFIHARGGDVREGSRVLRRGIVVGAPETAVLASAGRADAAVARLPRVAVVSTGDELVDVGEPITPEQIRSTNDRAIEAAIVAPRLGTVTRARLPDDRQTLLDRIAHLHADHDVLILSGGVSMGQFDFVPAVLEQLGARLVFHKIEQKPGRPMWFGLSGDGKPIFALPGNPVSALVCTARYVVPALRASLGLAPYAVRQAVLTAPVAMPRRLTCFMPVVLESGDDATLRAEPKPTNTSGDFVSLAGTDGFVELAAGPEAYPAGTVARLFTWNGLADR